MTAKVLVAVGQIACALDRDRTRSSFSTASRPRPNRIVAEEKAAV